ncbi:hypothetical protein LJU38_08030 [Klebsiella pneumoniae]|uniref:hypothetical protein n=1 Tax=Klebsiella pneumoniae TaxID=573 RepID=UPI001D0FCCDB|nr:hypothetical protein [Klebsiella pneumoniae]UDV59735.1 hypothetical protein LJU38_08030 [Klebsiella pneumoniae]
MAHDVPLGCAPDEYDDLISGTCSHLPYAFLCRFFGRKYRFSSDFAIIYLVCLPGNMGSEKGESLKNAILHTSAIGL